jgi:ribosomal protein S18 acetylase RimI-like enzyme
VGATLASQSSVNGLRPVNLRSDLGGIADLIELAFGPTMDEAGRANVREMRMLGQSGSLAALNEGLERLLGSLDQGFVWVEGGKIVGNVSTSPANYPRALGVGVIIANVAVHPDFRRRGIAEALMNATLDAIKPKQVDFAILQVDEANASARRLYTRLGFRPERTFGRWSRSPFVRAPERLTTMPDITLRQWKDWPAELALAEVSRPNDHGGLGWLRSTEAKHFRPSLINGMFDWVIGRAEDHWIIRDSKRTSILALLKAISSFGMSDRLELIVHPAFQGQYEEALINHTLRILDGRRKSVIIEHPFDDWAANAALQKYGFERRHTLLHMRLDF